MSSQSQSFVKYIIIVLQFWEYDASFDIGTQWYIIHFAGLLVGKFSRFDGKSLTLAAPLVS